MDEITVMRQCLVDANALIDARLPGKRMDSIRLPFDRFTVFNAPKSPNQEPTKRNVLHSTIEIRQSYLIFIVQLSTYGEEFASQQVWIDDLEAKFGELRSVIASERITDAVADVVSPSPTPSKGARLGGCMAL
jgi:hypothetical protein